MVKLTKEITCNTMAFSFHTRKTKKPKYFKCAYDSLFKKSESKYARILFKVFFNVVIKEWLRIGLNWPQILALVTTPNSSAWRVMSFVTGNPPNQLESVPPGYCGL